MELVIKFSNHSLHSMGYSCISITFCPEFLNTLQKILIFQNTNFSFVKENKEI